MTARRRTAKGRSLFEHAEIMDRLGDDWFDVVCSRRSRRTFDGAPLEDEMLDAVDAVCQGFRPFDDARVELWRDRGSDLFRGVVGSYGKVVGAPHVLAFVGRESDASQMHLGYTGEAVVLEATRLGLATCWVGGFFRHADADEMAGLTDSERVCAISPLGRSTTYSLTERLFQHPSGTHRRKFAEEIAPGLDDMWPRWAQVAVECARLAPSARNRQPWRFKMHAGDLLLCKDSGIELPWVTKALDCGIAALHAELGARAAGTTGVWCEPEEGAQELARFKAGSSS